MIEVCNRCPDLKTAHDRDDGDSRMACSLCECDDYEDEVRA